MKLSTEAWQIVAQHLPAQPVLYMRLATVSRQFHKIFMSDDVWSRVDVYGVGKQISNHFLSFIYLASIEELAFLRRLHEGKVDLEKDMDFTEVGWMNGNLYAFYVAFTGPVVIEPFTKWALNSTRCVLKIMAESGRVELLNASCKSNKTLCLAAVSRNGLKLAELPASLKKDKDVVLAAVRNNGLALEYADANLQKNDEVLYAAVFQNGAAIQWGPKFAKFGGADGFPKYAVSDRIILTAIKSNIKAGKYLNHAVLNHPDCFNAVISAGRGLDRAGSPSCGMRFLSRSVFTEKCADVGSDTEAGAGAGADTCVEAGATAAAATTDVTTDATTGAATGGASSQPTGSGSSKKKKKNKGN